MNPTRLGANDFRSTYTPIDRVYTSMIDVVSLTRQDQAEQCNINNIYKKTQQGQLSLVAKNPPVFGDFSDVGSYDVILETISNAKEKFMELSADIRKEYNNDPALYYDKVTEKYDLDAKKLKAERIEKANSDAYAKKVEDAKKLLKIEE